MKQHFNIVVPMAGRGSRFTEKYTDKKPFIDVNGKPMIQRVLKIYYISLIIEFNIICLQKIMTNMILHLFDDIIGHTHIMLMFR